MANTDIFGKKQQEITVPFTADRALLLINDQPIAGANNVSITYAQPIIKRRTLGNKYAIQYSGQPDGQISVAELVAFKTIPGASETGWPPFGTGIWTTCDYSDPKSREIKFEIQGGPCTLGEEPTDIYAFIATGCTITNYVITAEAESVSISHGVQISFMQLLDASRLS